MPTARLGAEAEKEVEYWSVWSLDGRMLAGEISDLQRFIAEQTLPSGLYLITGHAEGGIAEHSYQYLRQIFMRKTFMMS